MKLRFLAIALFIGTSSAGNTVKLAGHIHHASGKSVVYVALWGSQDGFLEKPAQTMRIAAGADTNYKFDVAPGQWAVSAFEDTNGNGVLDMGMFGPKEPSGFWRAFTAWHKPKFDEVSARVDKDIPDADITLR